MKIKGSIQFSIFSLIFEISQPIDKTPELSTALQIKDLEKILDLERQLR